MVADPSFIPPIIFPIVVAVLIAALFRGRSSRTPPAPKQERERNPTSGPELEAAIAAREGKPPSFEIAVWMHRLSQFRAEEGRLLEAERLADRVSQLVRDLANVGHEEMIGAWEHHVALLRAVGRVTDAERVQRSIVELSERIHPPRSPQLTRQRVLHATILQHCGRNKDAECVLREACEA